MYFLKLEQEISRKASIVIGLIYLICAIAFFYALNHEMYLVAIVSSAVGAIVSIVTSFIVGVNVINFMGSIGFSSLALGVFGSLVAFAVVVGFSSFIAVYAIKKYIADKNERVKWTQ